MGLKFNYSTRKKYLLIAAIVAVLAVGAGITRALLLGGSSSLSSSSDIDLQKGLVGWWKFDGNAKDSTPYADNGTVNGATPTTDREGATSSAYSFDGVSNSISIPDNAVLRITPDLSVSFWVKVGSITNKAGCCASFIQKEQTSTNRNYILYVNRTTGVITGSSSFGGVQYDLSSTVNINDNSWHHVVYEVAGTLQQIYVDGSLKNSHTNASNVDTQSGNLNISASGNLQGSLDDLRLYNRSLSSAEVTALYKSYNASLALGSGENGLLGWWKLDGNTVDSTPYANNGSLAGSTVPTLTTDREGASNAAYSFDGTATTGGYVVASNRSYYSPDVGLARTFSIWMKGGAQAHTGQLFYENGSCIGWY
ncbi:MAG TPA: LamG domain-containing protein, partial [Candidatus Saccharimonadales bacterium]|nr:LamG domain-containing protein [Candidatus Saccharimonadales bacterium]